MRAKSIYEKFTDDSDPIKDMGIGIYCEKRFKTKEEFISYLVSAFELITEHKLDSYVFNEPGTNIRTYLYIKLWKFLKKYKWRINHDPCDYLGWSTDFREKCKKFIKINEVFTDESDPIEDMGIGAILDFEKIAQKTIQNKTLIGNKVAARESWLGFLRDLIGIEISGKFGILPKGANKAAFQENLKVVNKTFIILDFYSYGGGVKLFFKGEDSIYKVIPGEQYYYKAKFGKKFYDI